MKKSIVWFLAVAILATACGGGPDPSPTAMPRATWTPGPTAVLAPTPTPDGVEEWTPVGPTPLPPEGWVNCGVWGHAAGPACYKLVSHPEQKLLGTVCVESPIQGYSTDCHYDGSQVTIRAFAQDGEFLGYYRGLLR